MPLLKNTKGKTKAGISKNISTLVKEHKPKKQSIAIALEIAKRKMKRKKA